MTDVILNAMHIVRKFMTLHCFIYFYFYPCNIFFKATAQRERERERERESYVKIAKVRRRGVT